MTESTNPFAGSSKLTKSNSRGGVFAWALTLAAVIVAVLFSVLWSREKTAKQREVQTLKEELDRTSGELLRAISVLQTNNQQIAFLTNQVADLSKQKEMVGERARTLEDEMRQQLESKDVTISKLQGKLTVTIVDRVMFDSGEAVLKPDGAGVMQKIAELLTSHPELKIHVIGHTDNVPIRQTATSKFASNWELSAARALAAVHFLIDKAEIDPRRLGAVGYGEFRPIANNTTAEGRARNRRIEISVLPDEPVEPDTAIATANSEKPAAVSDSETP